MVRVQGSSLGPRSWSESKFRVQVPVRSLGWGLGLSPDWGQDLGPLQGPAGSESGVGPSSGPGSQFESEVAPRCRVWGRGMGLGPNFEVSLLEVWVRVQSLAQDPRTGRGLGPSLSLGLRSKSGVRFRSRTGVPV
uniref:Uncharacterized protein n=1 Tax=Cannabis sativa TaxID=3483 RepID=A0A803NTP2_CANSA